MRKIFIIRNITMLLLIILGTTSCKDTWMMYDANQKNNLFFVAVNDVDDLVRDVESVHSFVFEPENEVEYKIEVNMMGMVVPKERLFAINIIDDTAKLFKLGGNDGTRNIVNAKEGLHYSSIKCVVPANSPVGYIYIKLKRHDDMKDNAVSFKCHIAENEEFQPRLHDNTFRLIIIDGDPLCPTWWKISYVGVTTNWYMYLGDFSPMKFRKLLEYYHEMKSGNPILYNIFEDKYGYNLDKLQEGDVEIKTGFFQFDSPAVWAKYVLCPLYEYQKANYPDSERGGYFPPESSGMSVTTGGWRDPRALFR